MSHAVLLRIELNLVVAVGDGTHLGQVFRVVDNHGPGIGRDEVVASVDLLGRLTEHDGNAVWVLGVGGGGILGDLDVAEAILVGVDEV